MTLKEKRARMAAVSAELERIYPTAECALEYNGDPWRLLVMGRLSAQCTDARVNIVSKELFERFPTPEALAAAELSEIEKIIMPCGLFRTKAESIKAASAMLVTEYGGTLPDTMDELLRFPGVGRKIANLLLGDIFGKAAIVCDTHCIRICGRLGMYPESEKNAEKVERILRTVIDPEKGSDFCHRIVFFGRETCTARSPRCEECRLAPYCRHREKRLKK